MGNRGPYAKTAHTQVQILTAALESVSENGYGATSLQQIADAVGMTKPGLLHHFGSRDGLLVAILDRHDELGYTLIRGDEDDDGPDAIDGFIRLVAHNATVPGLVAVFAATVGVGAGEQEGSQTREFTQRHYPGIIRVLTEAARARQGAGLMRDDIPAESIGRALVAASDGIQLQWLVDPSVDMRGELEAILRAYGA